MGDSDFFQSVTFRIFVSLFLSNQEYFNLNIENIQ